MDVRKMLENYEREFRRTNTKFQINFLKMNKEKLKRCGACGQFLQDPRLYSKEEQDNAELIHCGCETEEQPRYVTRDMAIDGGDINLEGQRYD